MTEIFYNHRLKKLGLEGRADVIPPLKIARRIRMLAKQLRQKEAK